MESHLEERSLSRRDFLKLGGAGLAGAALLGTGGPARAAASRSGQGTPSGSGGSSIKRREWGEVDDQPVYLYTLSNGRQMSVEITNYGGIVRSILVPDRAGRVENVALGFSNLADYVENSTRPAPGG
jgi:aldose 1-epimerase